MSKKIRIDMFDLDKHEIILGNVNELIKEILKTREEQFGYVDKIGYLKLNADIWIEFINPETNEITDGQRFEIPATLRLK